MIYQVNQKETAPLLENHLKLGGDNGIEKIEVTSQYIRKNGKPWVPFMGEYHYSRAKESEWKRELCKMKAGGVNVIATYVIWIHHEEKEGEVSFEGNLNIRKFVETCYDCGLHVALRIGPWIHGEVKNGGFPDWLQHKEGVHLRSNDPEYLKYCKSWFTALAAQLEGLMFKDGKPLFAIQIENELTTNEEHIATLLEMAKEVGFDAPVYTATGWGTYCDAQLPRDKVIPMYGGYPEAPWTPHTEKLDPSNHYFFTATRNDSNIGLDLLGTAAGDVSQGGLDYNLYPYATCELGGGVQITYIRRPMIEGTDIAAITNVKLGSGANLLGYYMYHGGRNPIGETTTMQETIKSGYYNDYPIIDYDFQAQLGAWGAVRNQYRLCRIPALFLEDFGEEFAQCRPYFSDLRIESVFDTESLRYAMRLNGNSGFVFVNNYSREQELSEHKGVQFDVDGTAFPADGLHIQNGEYGFMPYHMKLGEVVLKYSAMQPICKQEHSYFFFAPFEKGDTFCFDKNTVSKVEGNAEITYLEDEIIVKKPAGSLKVYDQQGNVVLIEILTRQEAQHLSRQNGRLYLSEGDVYSMDNEIYVYSTEVNKLGCKVYRDGKFCDCIVEKPEEDAVNVRVVPAERFETDYMDEFELGGNLERQYFELELPNNRENLILCMDIVGDIAQLYADGKLIADAFLQGRTWYVGPDDFLDCDSLKLVVSKMDSKDKYLEADNMDGLQIKSIKGKRLYTIKL